MCSVNLRAQRGSSYDDLFRTRKLAEGYVNNLVNGNFLKIPKQANVGDKVTVCLSTICALCKEFNLDWIENGLEHADQESWRKAMAEFGSYLETPLRTLSSMLRRLRLAGRRPGFMGFQYHLDAYWDALGLRCCDAPNRSFPDKLGDDPRFLLLVYLHTALTCHDLWQRRQDKYQPIPWTIRCSRSGRKVTLRYNCWLKSGDVVKRSKFDYILTMRIPVPVASQMRTLLRDLAFEVKPTNQVTKPVEATNSRLRKDSYAK